MKSLVSIIMPAYNAGKYIGKAISSVLDQSYQNWQLIVVDDGSKDDTASIVHSFRDTRIVYIYQPNAGVSVARNTGLEQARGTFLTFLDSDDWFPPESLSLRIEYMDTHPEVQMLAGAVAFYKSDKLLRRWTPDVEGNPLQHFIRLDQRTFCNPSMFIRNEPGFQSRFKPGQTHVEDLLYFSRLASERPILFASIDSTVYHYRVGEGSAMANLQGLEKGYWEFYDEVSTFDQADPRNIRYLRKRVFRIMFLSYLAGRQPLRVATLIKNFLTRTFG